MPSVTADQAKFELRVLFPDFVSIVQSAWTDWMAGAYAHQMQHKRVRAGCVWNQLISNAKRTFEGRQSVRVETLRNWDGVLVNDRVFVRMKKADSKLLSRNYPTQAALDFHDPQKDLFDGIIRLELLYVLNKLETAVERIVLVQRHRAQIAWAIDLLDQADGATQNVLPLVPIQPVDGAALRMIKPKDEKKRDRKREPRSAS
jgi:hypothetical protein